MRLSRYSLAMLLVGFLACAPVASAAKVKIYAPPGKAGTSEYSEVVPTAGGNVLPPADGGGNPTAAQISRIGSGKAGVRKLSKLGKQGPAAAAFAQATAPVTTTAHSTGRSTGTHPSAGTRPSADARPPAATLRSSGGSALTGLTNLLGGSDVDGLGTILPLLLAFGLGVAVAVSALRLRHGRRPPA